MTLREKAGAERWGWVSNDRVILGVQVYTSQVFLSHGSCSETGPGTEVVQNWLICYHLEVMMFLLASLDVLVFCFHE